MKIINKPKTILSCLFLLLTFSSCNVVDTKTSSTLPGKQASSTPYTFTWTSHIFLSSLQKLAYYADIIVIAKVTAKKDIINTARNPSDPTKPDTRGFGISQVYSIEIKKYLKGEGAEVLDLAQGQGSLKLDSPEARPSATDIELEIKKNEGKEFTPLDMGVRYLMFLRILDKIDYEMDGYKSVSLYAGVSEPWLFLIDSSDRVSLQTFLDGLEACFPVQSLEAVIEQIGGPFDPDQPPPPCVKDGSPAPLSQTPYP